nr:glycoside hydrolase 43 family protein [Aeoliella straminimaris]
MWSPAAARYRNPIICADYSDPDVVRHGDDFYLTASSFNCTPGLPVLHSRDLIHWQIINHAVRNLPSERYQQVQHGCGVWAPAIRHHDGRFWIFFPMPDEGIYVTTAIDPRGRWSPPHLLQEGVGLIDPCPLWDDDGNAYLVHAFAHSRSGIRHRLQVVPMAPDASQLMGEGQVVFEQPEKHPIIEGPKFLKKDGWYYILAPAGGVEEGWQVALRSRAVFGPYEDRIVLAQGTSAVNGPHQGALVDTPNGQWWFVHFQDAGPYGRITHLQPVKWQDGWPLMGLEQDEHGVGEPVSEHPVPAFEQKASPVLLQDTDNFDTPTLGLQWQWHANHHDDWYSLDAEPGRLRLFAQPASGGRLSDAPHLLLQKFPCQQFTATTHLSLPQDGTSVSAGLVVVGATYAGLLVSRQGDRLQVQRVQSDASDELVVLPDASSSDESVVWLRVEVHGDATCLFSYSGDGQSFTSLGGSFQATAGKWIGAKVGIVCTGDESHADFHSFQVHKRTTNEGSKVAATALPPTIS